MSWNNHIPRYCRHKSTDRGYARFEGGDGPQTYFPGPYGSPESRAAYDAAVAEWLRTGRVRRVQPGEVVTAADLILAFWRHVDREGHYRKGGRDTSEKPNLRAAFRVLADESADRPTAEFGVDDMNALRKIMVAKGWTEGTVKNHLQRVRSLFEWGKDHNLVPESVRLIPRKGLAARVKHRGRENRARRPPDLFAVGAVQLVAWGPVRAMIWLQLLNGMRPGGVCALRPCDLDTAHDVWVYTEPPDTAAKTGSERHWLGPRAQAILRPWLDVAPTPHSRVFRTTARPGGNRTGGWSVAYYRTCVAQLCDRLGVEHWSPHQLRHAHATKVENMFGREAAQNGWGIPTRRRPEFIPGQRSRFWSE
jgi:integrase